MLYKDFVQEKSRHLTRIKSAEGYPCEFDKSKGKALKDYKVYGNSTQDGTPSTTSPIEIQSVGDLVTDATSEHYGKYKIPVTVSSKNIFGGTAFRDRLIELGGTLNEKNKTVTISASNLNNKVLFDKFDADKRYTFIFSGYNTNTSVTSHNTNVKIVYSDDTFENGFFNSKVGTKGTWYYKSTENKPIKHLIGVWHTASTVFYYEECGIFEGTISLDEFEPYSGIQTNIFLDTPLRRIKVIEGNKKGDYGDYIDFKRGVVVRNTIKKIFDGTETWGTINDYTIYSYIGGGEICNALCTRSQVRAGHYGVTWYKGATTYSNGGSGFMWNHGGTMTIDEWKAQLAQWYDEGNPLTVVCARTTPIEKAIELPSVLTLKGNNILTTTTTVTPSNIEVKYIAK